LFPLPVADAGERPAGTAVLEVRELPTPPREGTGETFLSPVEDGVDPNRIGESTS